MTRRQRLARWCHKNAAYILLTAVFMFGALVGAVVSCSISTSANAADDSKVTESVKATDENQPNTVAEEVALVEISHPCTQETFVPDQAEVEMLAKLIWGEARGIKSDTEKAAVVWCVLNRVDSPKFPDTVAGVVTQRHQFSGYKDSFPVLDEFKTIAADVLTRWNAEKNGSTDVGRILPSDYVFFTGDGVRNHFTVEWQSADTWNWSLPSPYES